MDYEKFWDDLFRMAKQDEEYQWNLERVRGLEFIVLCTGAGAPMPSPMGKVARPEAVTDEVLPQYEFAEMQQ